MRKDRINWAQVSRNRRRGWGRLPIGATEQEIQQVRTILEELSRQGYVGSEPPAAAFGLVHVPADGLPQQMADGPAAP